MRGDRVLVRGFRDEARVCRVLGVSGDTVQLTDDEGFTSLERGEYTEKIVTFLLSDTFLYDQTVKNGSFPRWERLKPYTRKVLH